MKVDLDSGKTVTVATILRRHPDARAVCASTGESVALDRTRDVAGMLREEQRLIVEVDGIGVGDISL